MQNKKQEIELAIESKFVEVGSLIQEYENLGGKITCLTIANFDDEDSHYMAMNGVVEDIGNLLFNNEDVADAIMAYQIMQIIKQESVEE